MQSGRLSKMEVRLKEPIEYQLCLGAAKTPLNGLIGRQLELQYLDKITCGSCGKRTKKSYAQGFCYPCMRSAPEVSECVLRPELCRGHLGEGRDVEWEVKNHVRPHLVYLAVSGGLKVGVTRADQEPTRWIDQGAVAAIIIAKTPNRCLAGEIEVELKQSYSDKTNWRRMLKGEDPEVDLVAERSRALSLLPSAYREYGEEHTPITHISYPLAENPRTLKSIKLEREGGITGILQGIRGQYLIFDGDRVINLRSHTGYEVALTTH